MKNVAKADSKTSVKKDYPLTTNIAKANAKLQIK